MQIRIAQPADAVPINIIYNEAIEERLTADTIPLSLAARAHWLKAHGSNSYPVFVIDVNSEVTGWLSFSAYREGRKAFQKTAEISYYIKRSYRRKGMGTTLVQFAIQQAPHYGFKHLIAMLLEWNTGSIRLLENNGFNQWGFMPQIADFEGTTCGHLYYGLSL